MFKKVDGDNKQGYETFSHFVQDSYMKALLVFDIMDQNKGDSRWILEQKSEEFLINLNEYGTYLS